MGSSDSPVLISAAPTVRIAGQSLPLLTHSIHSMRVTEQIGGLSNLELSLYDNLSYGDGTAGWGATATSPVQLGASIKIYCGETSTPQEVFDGVITAIEGEYADGRPPLFTVLAEDRLWGARRKRRSRVFENQSPADLVRAIASDHGLTPQVRDGLDAPQSDWMQMNESDLAFLRRILARFDCDLQAVDDKLQAGRRAADARTSVVLRNGAELVRGRIIADLAEQATSVRVGGFDGAAGEAVDAVATSGELGPGAGTDGPSALRRRIGEVAENSGDADALSCAEGDAVARALYGQRARRFVRIDGCAQGDPQIRVGSRLTIKDVNPFFENDYSVTRAVHRFDIANGYLTDFLAECAFLGDGA
ncbi:phage late control D family protein [Paraburkholderia atlantica]|uniref:phage late control D family protein n=1 Tax=Paraburkholderia atlantica TaxID=2654982 RepID=UPI003D1B7831